MTLVKELEGRGTINRCRDQSLQWGFAVGERDWAQLAIQGRVEIYGQGAGWGVSGWKITKRKHEGQGEILANQPNRILAEGRKGDQPSPGGQWGTKNLVTYRGWRILAKMT